MIISRRQFSIGSLALLAISSRDAHAAPSPARVLIVDGINNHDWATATHAITEILTATTLFSVEVSTTPPRGASPDAWNSWAPDFSRYDVVINNFNGGHLADGIEWPLSVQGSLEKFVQGGGGLVVYHAANNAFLNWPAYNEMIGLGWRSPSFGPGLAVSDDGKILVIPKGTGLEPGILPGWTFRSTCATPTIPSPRGCPGCGSILRSSLLTVNMGLRKA